MTQPRAIVSAIIEREVKGVFCIYTQTRWKPSTDPINSGTIEIPAGSIVDPSEAKDPRRITISESKEILNTAPKRIFSLQLSSLRYYVEVLTQENI